MKGHVPTPEPIVDLMVSKLFHPRPPRAGDVLIDPGCGDGPFIEGVLRFCRAKKAPVPRIIGVELNPSLLQRAQERVGREVDVELVEKDYLMEPTGPADFVIGNPPYVSITHLDEDEKARYRARFSSAKGRFDLYILFLERSLQNLKPGGRLCFITPEKFEYVETAMPLRKLLARQTVEELHHIEESAFAGLTTYPTITTLEKASPSPKQHTRVITREGDTLHVSLPRDGSSWASASNRGKMPSSKHVLADVCLRISCGIATGADEVFVAPSSDLTPGLEGFAFPTISGRQLGTATEEEAPRAVDVLLVPYDGEGRLLPEHRLGALREYLMQDARAERLRRRTCATDPNRPWYRFHDNVPLQDILRPKLLCKDIAARPHFARDSTGAIVPRHTVYYIVPRPGVDLVELQRYLNSQDAASWLTSNCQRAANGFLRLQSNVLKKLPIPDALVHGLQDAAGGVQLRLGETPGSA